MYKYIILDVCVFNFNGVDVVLLVCVAVGFPCGFRYVFIFIYSILMYINLIFHTEWGDGEREGKRAPERIHRK